MARVLLLLVAVGLTIYALLDIGRTPHQQTRTMPKLLWFVVALIPLVGPVLWLIAGRPRPARAVGTPGSAVATPFRPRRRGPSAPDDDPEFLRRLADEAWAKRMEEQRRARESGAAAPAAGTTAPAGATDRDPVAPPTGPTPPAAATDGPGGESGREPRAGREAPGADDSGVEAT